jgi:hypothetical protein
MPESCASTFTLLTVRLSNPGEPEEDMDLSKHAEAIEEFKGT